jgi:hypothetical protein
MAARLVQLAGSRAPLWSPCSMALEDAPSRLPRSPGHRTYSPKRRQAAGEGRTELGPENPSRQRGAAHLRGTSVVKVTADKVRSFLPYLGQTRNDAPSAL